jgi:hypothetical protein
VQQLIAVEFRVAGRSAFHNALPHFGSPCEIGAKLSVVHVPITGIAGGKRSLFGKIVGEILQQFCLLIEQLSVTIMVFCRIPHQSLGFHQRSGQKPLHL